MTVTGGPDNWFRSNFSRAYWQVAEKYAKFSLGGLRQFRVGADISADALLPDEGTSPDGVSSPSGE